jgi:energy-coupling factor transport system ATP-binding protein
MSGMRTAAVVTLSGGQKQRTAIAATLAMQPRILVLDEPLSDLDPVGAQEVLSTLQRLARHGGTGVVVIEHRVDEVAPWADRVVLMDDGRVVLDQPPRAAWAEPGPWRATGVGIPDMVRLAHAVPEAFGSRLPLSLQEATDAVKDTWFEAALAAAAAERRSGAGQPAGRRNGRAADAAPAVGGGPPVLSWDGVSVEFDGKRAVDDVTLAVNEGEWVALIGANGSGKSTLTGLTVGLGKPSAGVVRFRGQPVRPGKVFDHAAQVALLLQAADDMLFETTVRKELEFGFRFRARPKEPVLDVPEAVEFFGFTGREEDSPWELSQGGRQRLALAALLVGAPGVLVLDEPTTGQDANHMRSFLQLLDRVRARTGITIVTVTHDIRGLASRAARVVLLGEGQVRADGPTSQVFAMSGDLIRWGVLAPPLARLQSELLGPAAGDVLLEVDELASTVLAHRPAGARAISPGTGALRS